MASQNRAGTPMVYCSSSLALAVLEVLVHGSPEDLEGELQAISAVLPSRTTLEVVSTEELPQNWRAHPPRPATAHLGSRWAMERRSRGLVVPSAVVPLEWSVLLHSQVGEGAIVEQVERHAFSFDPWLHDRN